jgi:hypothetical protein
VGSLFASFDFDQLPNVVNLPTYERLCTFLRDDLKRAELVPRRMSVRKVVDAIKMYNTSGTLCWRVVQEMHDGAEAAQDGMGDFGSTQRVFAHCAKAVLAKVEAAVAALRRRPTVVTTAAAGSVNTGAAVLVTVAPGTTASPASVGAVQGLEQWMSSHDLLHLGGPLQTLGVFVLKDLPFGIAEGDITVESLVDAGVKSRLQARRLLQAAATLEDSEA